MKSTSLNDVTNNEIKVQNNKIHHSMMLQIIKLRYKRIRWEGITITKTFMLKINE